MTENKPITIMIHDLTPWGGQDRSMLEIAWQMNKDFPLEIHSFQLEGYKDWPNMKHIKYDALIKRPILFKYLNYHFKSWNNLNKSTNPIVQSTGTASLKSDVIQVQFIHHTWLEIAKSLPNDKFQRSSPLKSIYQRFLKLYKLRTEKQVYTPDKHYIAISHGIKKELMTHFGIPSENITIIHHGVDHTHFTPVQGNPEAQKTKANIREKLNIKPNDIVLLHVGALNARKGIFQSLKTINHLKKNGFDNIKYLAVGQGDKKALDELINEFDLKDEVIFAPHSKDIRDYYWASDIFFFPSFYEPFGLVLLEAMACGLPVVASNLAGGSELIEEGHSGLLFDPNDSEKNIANSLLPALRSAEYRSQLGEAARKVAIQRSWETVGQEYRDLYHKLSPKDL